MPLLEFYDIIECYRECLERGITIKAYIVKDHYWTDMGTPDDYLKLHEYLLCSESSSSRIYLGKNAIMDAGVKLNDWVCIGSNAVIGRDANLTRVVVWDGAKVLPGTTLTDVIVT